MRRNRRQVPTGPVSGSTTTTTTTSTSTSDRIILPSCLLVPQKYAEHNQTSSESSSPNSIGEPSSTSSSMIMNNTGSTTTTNTATDSQSTSVSSSPSPPSSPLSVTLISQKILPSYSSERFYLLSELEVHAAKTMFLSSSSLYPPDDHSTQATEEEEVDDDDDDDENEEEMLHDKKDTTNHNISPTVDNDNTLSVVQQSSSAPTGTLPTTTNTDVTTTTTTNSSSSVAHHETADTTTITTTTTTTSSSTGITPQQQQQIPSYILLYILWKPDMTCHPSIFIQHIIMEAMSQLQVQQQQQPNTSNNSHDNNHNHYIEIRQSRCKHNTTTSTGSNNNLGRTTAAATTTTTTTSEAIQSSASLLNHNNNKSTTQQQQRCTTASIYIVIDRVIPRVMRRSTTATTAMNDDTQQQQQQQQQQRSQKDKQENDDEEQHQQHEQQQLQLVQSLARSVASHPILRDVIDGITIGISDHVRAAPGLELCIDAITKIGHIDRRRYRKSPVAGTTNHSLFPTNYRNPNSPSSVSNATTDTDSKKSLLGIVAFSKNDLLGLQDIANTDAAEHVQQSIVTAEWYGLGDIYMFASRAHMAWKQQYNVIVGIDADGNNNSNTDATLNGTFATSDPLFRKRKLPRRLVQPNRREVIMLSSSSSSKRKTTFIGSTIQQRCRNDHSHRMTLQEERELLDDIYDILGYILIITYIVYHFVFATAVVVGVKQPDSSTDVTQSTSANLYNIVVSLIQHIINLWIDLIRSARGW